MRRFGLTLLSIALAAASSVFAFAESSQVEVAIKKGPVTGGQGARLLAIGPTQPIPLDLGPARDGKVSFAGAGPWTIWVEGKDVWSVPVETLAPGRVELALQPASSVQGKLLPPRGEKSPGSVQLRISQCSKRTIVADVTCAVQKDGLFRCPAPVSCFDARVRIPGYVAHYFWDLKSPAAERSIPLGNLVLKKGASVAGWLVTEDSRPFDASTRVRLSLQGLKTDTKPLTAKLEMTSSSITPARNGFFQFVDIAPGNYELVASQDGYGSASEPLVYVKEGLESALREPLVLSRPRSVEFQVSPSTAPDGTAWGLRLMRHRPSGTAMIDLKLVDATGFVTFDGLEPGKYAWALHAGGRGGVIVTEQIEISNLVEHFNIEVPLVFVEGTVLLGDEPLPEGKVIFGGSTGAQSISIPVDYEGQFKGALPRAGKWKVEVVNWDINLQRTLAAVDVPKPKGSKPATVELELSDGRLEGMVVDEEFVPQKKALVEIRPGSPDEGLVTARTSDIGIFELRGLPEGPATVRAETDDAQSEPQLVSLTSDTSDRIQLVVKKRRSVRVTVMDRAGPVAGANTWFREFGGVMDRGDGGVTEFDGSLEIALASDINVIHARVAAPGRTFYVGRRDIRDGAVRVDIPTDGGALDLRYPPDLWEWVFLIHDGASSWYGPFQSWAALHEQVGGLRDFSAGRLVVPKLALGDWHVCLVQPGSDAWIRASALGTPVAENCRSFLSQPGSTASIDLTDLGRSR